MSISRRQLIQFAGATSLLSAAPSLVLAQKLEKTSVHIAVGLSLIHILTLPTKRIV